jgi:hypothetical protein
MNSDIREAFETRIAAFAAAQNLSVAWENTTFTPSPATPYLECAMLPATSANPALGVNFIRLLGIYQINVNYPEDTGPAPAEAIADALIALFPRGSMAQNDVVINIDYTPSRAKGLVSPNGFFFIPVRIRYREDVIS